MLCPIRRCNLVALLSLWQPLRVITASGIAYRTAAKYRCNPTLLSCHVVVSGGVCCTVSSNMGWRYKVIVLGGITLLIFFLRFFVFRFYESPKFLLSVGKEAEAIEVLHKIAKFNKAPALLLTIAHFAAVESGSSQASVQTTETLTKAQRTKRAMRAAGRSVSNLKALSTNKLHISIFFLLAIAYMVSPISDQISIFMSRLTTE